MVRPHLGGKWGTRTDMEAVEKTSPLPSPGDRKSLGRYYTPDELTEIIANWAIRSAADTVLEPSFGGCGFIAAANKRLLDLGTTRPADNIFGCDIDPRAFDHLSAVGGFKSAAKNFIEGDFLGAKVNHWRQKKFATVIGNPPYVSHHNMSSEQKDTAWHCLAQHASGLPKTASLWAYFVLRSMTFLKSGGRMGLILPDAFLTSQYAEFVRACLVRHFEVTRVIRKGFHSFKEAGATERTICLLAEGYSDFKIEGAYDVCFAGSITELRQLSAIVEKPRSRRNISRPAVRANYLPPPGKFEKLLTENFAASTKELVHISIGLVTGANRYFIVDPETVGAYRLPKHTLLPIWARAADCAGLEYTSDDHAAAVGSNRKCWLFRPMRLGKKWGPVRNYLASVPREVRKNTLWFTKREHWYSPTDYQPPDAFLTYMNHLGPRLVLNSEMVDCTNTLHRIWFKARASVAKRRLMAISLQSSFSQISAERMGRSYGGGVLKLEPSEFRVLKLILPKGIHHSTISKTFSEVDSAVRAGDHVNAQAIADRLVLESTIGASCSTIAQSELSKTLGKLRLNRTA